MDKVQAWFEEATAIAAPQTCRHTDADLSLCRLVRKACLALEIIELPAIEFVDALGTAVRKTNITSSYAHGSKTWTYYAVNPLGSPEGKNYDGTYY